MIDPRIAHQFRGLTLLGHASKLKSGISYFEVAVYTPIIDFTLELIRIPRSQNNCDLSAYVLILKLQPVSGSPPCQANRGVPDNRDPHHEL